MPLWIRPIDEAPAQVVIGRLFGSSDGLVDRMVEGHGRAPAPARSVRVDDVAAFTPALLGTRGPSDGECPVPSVHSHDHQNPLGHGGVGARPGGPSCTQECLCLRDAAADMAARGDALRSDDTPELPPPPPPSTPAAELPQPQLPPTPAAARAEVTSPAKRPRPAAAREDGAVCSSRTAELEARLENCALWAPGVREVGQDAHTPPSGRPRDDVDVEGTAERAQPSTPMRPTQFAPTYSKPAQ